jgi:hypothetical protein
MADDPWFMEKAKLRCSVTSMAMGRLEVLADRHGVGEGQVVDWLVRAYSDNDVDLVIDEMRARDVLIRQAYEESGRCIPS